MSAPVYVGNDVIAQRGQNLTDDETLVLGMLADGRKPTEIADAIGGDRFTLRAIESALHAKLGSVSKPHLIGRGFVLQVLAPRALCLLLAMCSLGVHVGDHSANRAPRRTRTPVTAMRAQRASRSSRDGDGPMPDLAQLFAQVA